MDNQEKPLELEGKFKTATELGLSEAKRCGLLKTLAFIEAGKTLHAKNLDGERVDGFPIRFNMRVWHQNRNCGTVACLGGTAEILSNESYSRAQLPAELQKLFGIHGTEFKHMGGVTERQAAVALRGYLETGKTDWDAARKTPR